MKMRERKQLMCVDFATHRLREMTITARHVGDMTGLLLGLGLRSFSMHPSQILTIKQQILRADTTRLAPWAQAVLASDEPAARMQAP